MPDTPDDHADGAAGAAVPAPPASNAIVPAKEVERGDFIETFNVREHGRRYEVAANAVANKAMMQINVAKLRSLAERAIKPYLENPELPVGPKELKILVESAETIERMADAAYSNTKQGNLANALEKLVFAAAKGGAQGAGAGTSGDMPQNRLARMKRLIGKAKPVIQEAEIVEEEAP